MIIKPRLRDRLRTEDLIMRAIKTGLVPEFVSSVEAFYDSRGSITRKQWDALLNILEEHAMRATLRENQLEIW